MDEANSTTKITLPGECDETLLHLSHLTDVQLQALAVQKGKQSYLSAHWNAHIFLPLHPLGRGDETALLCQDPEDIDLCSYLDGNAGFAKKLYFSPKTYPPITEEDSDVTITEKFDAVDALIKSKAKDAGSPVVIGQSKMKFAKSTKKKGDLFRVYLCGHCNSNGMRGGAVAEKIRVEKVAVPDDKYRETNLVNNVKGKARRTGSGRGAKGLHRRRNKALRDKACPFRFRLRVDNYGFFITLFGDCGSSLHEGHPRFDPNFIPTQLSSLIQEERKDAQYVLNATMNNGCGREFMKAKFNKYLPTNQIAYLNSFCKEDKLDQFQSLFDMFEKSDKIRYNLLWTAKKDSTNDDVQVLSTTKVLGKVTQESALLQDNEKNQLFAVSENNDSTNDDVQATSTTKVSAKVTHESSLLQDEGKKALLPVAENAIKQRKSRGIKDEEQVFHCIA